MMKQTFTILFTLVLFFATAQTTADFENFNLDPDTSINNAAPDLGFTSGNIFLPNTFTVFPTFEAWDGWAISNDTDNVTPGFMNDRSVITGTGAEGTPTYAVSFKFGENRMHLEGDAAGKVVDGMYITNSTYAYFDMSNGGFVSKKFGGLSGDDPDYFLLTIKAYFEGQLSTDSIDFYLADFRPTDNTQDYILDEWTYVDLTSLGNVDSLAFTLTSSDNDPTYGMNTPAYFCIDKVTTADAVSNKNLEAKKSFNLSPNPASDIIVLENLNSESSEVSIFDMMGKNIYNNTITNFKEVINIAHLPCGTYVIKVQQDGNIASQLFVKK